MDAGKSGEDITAMVLCRQWLELHPDIKKLAMEII